MTNPMERKVLRTQEEILEKVRAVADYDFFGVMTGDLVEFLTYDNAKEFLNDEVTQKDWKPKKTTAIVIKNCIKDYLPFAWEKANDCRGLSANRSIDHMTVYLWLLNNEELQRRFDETEYEHYGKEKLIVVSEAVGFNWKEVDDGVRTNTDY